MLNETWFPTPEKLSNKIRYLIDWDRVNNILDPSAGRGDLLIHVIGNIDTSHNSQIEKDDIQVNPSHTIKNIYAIEIDPSLRGALSKIKYCKYYNSTPQSIKIIGSDFLNYSGFYEIDCIVMNPPFNYGAEHLLKAIDLIKKGQLFCILNKETIENKYSKTREILNNQIKKYNGKIIDLGKPFTKNSERKTNVECVLVHLDIDKKESFIQLDFSKMETAKEKSFAVNFDEEKFVVEQNDIKSAVALYQKKVELYKEFLQSLAKLRFYGGNALTEEIEDFTATYNKYIEELTIESWKKLINLNRFSKYMTKRVKDEFFKHVNNNSYLEFNEENIIQFLDSLVFSFENIMEESILALFEKLTKYDKKNVIEKDGWWTNDSFKVNRRVIIPRIWPWYSRDSFGSVDSDAEILFNDLDRMMMYISGEKLTDLNNPNDDNYFRNRFENGIADVIEKNKKDIFNKEFDSNFFRFRMYKKPDVCGTIHLEFKDEKLWQEFNIRAALKKNWLPDDYKARRKENMKRGLFIEYKKAV